ncbi:MAG: hypothetical protein MI923_10210 [Phycisphaerales bacterium]|nr:hypothetical protein [Phycisphaerales bacterium]
MDDMPMDNVFQLALIDLLFQVVDLVINFFTGVLIPGLVNGILGLFQPMETMM